jgi:DNA-binding NtrC family response regulator
MRPLLRLVPADPPTSGGPGGAAPGTKPTNGNRATPTVLVVEDEILVRMPLAEFLRDCGYRVIEAANAADAQAVFKAGQPIEAVFSDVHMPGAMNGIGLAEWIQREYPDVQIILSSGVDTTAAGRKGILFLPKPFSFEALAQHIKTLLGA